MSPRWVVEEDVFDEQNFEALLKEIVAQGMEYCRISRGRTMRYDFWKNRCVLCYGSVSMVKFVSTVENGWLPKSFLITDNLRCSSYGPFWGPTLLNDQAVYTTCADLRRNKDFFFSKVASPLGLFVRPDSCLKPFSGIVLDNSQFDSEIDYLEYAVREGLVLVGPAKAIEAEWRFVVAKRKVIAGSRYILEGKVSLSRDVEPGALVMAQTIGYHDWQPDVVYILDIAKSKGEYRVIEPNSFSSADFYECDKKPIVEVAKNLCREEWEMGYGMQGGDADAG